MRITRDLRMSTESRTWRVRETASRDRAIFIRFEHRRVVRARHDIGLQEHSSAPPRLARIDRRDGRPRDPLRRGNDIGRRLYRGAASARGGRSAAGARQSCDEFIFGTGVAIEGDPEAAVFSFPFGFDLVNDPSPLGEAIE